MTRPSVWVLPVAVLLAMAGCAGVAPADRPSEQSSTSAPTPTLPTFATQTETATTAAETTTTVPRRAYPDPPDDLQNDTVIAVAIAYERDRLHNELRNRSVASFDVDYIYPATAEVLNRSGGVFVRVRAYYSYGTGEVAADEVPVDSLYVVNTSGIRHVATLD